MSEKKATLNITGDDGSQHAIDLAVHNGTLGPDVVDVGSLTAVKLPTSTTSGPKVPL